MSDLLYFRLLKAVHLVPMQQRVDCLLSPWLNNCLAAPRDLLLYQYAHLRPSLISVHWSSYMTGMFNMTGTVQYGIVSRGSNETLVQYHSCKFTFLHHTLTSEGTTVVECTRCMYYLATFHPCMVVWTVFTCRPRWIFHGHPRPQLLDVA